MGPLHGIRVLDLSRLFPGPYATLLLSDLGADVVKIEDTKGGDYIRHFPPHASDGNGAAFHALNRGKQSVALDLSTGEGKDTFLALVARADVVVESFRPGVLEKLGLAPDVLLATNPSLVVCRISGFGQSGPLAKRAGHDLGYAARAGVLAMMKAPSALPVQVADLVGGAWPAALQIVAALVGRQASGQGAVIDVSMTDGAHAMLVMPLARQALVDEEIAGGRDLLVGSVPCYDVYETKDGHLAVGALEPKFWMAFCAAAELTDLASDGLSSGDDGARVRAQVAARLREKTTAEWSEVLAPFDCCVEPVCSPEEARASLRERGLTVDVDVDGARLSLPAPPLSLARDRLHGPARAVDDAARERVVVDERARVMLSPLFRLLTTPALALFAWTLAEGARVFATGRYSGRVIAREDVENHPHALLLPDASAIDYGFFGSFLVEKGLDPHALAPFFVAVGTLGLVGVVLLLLRRQMGYALVITAALGAAVRIGVPSLVALALVVVLLVPRVRRAFFRAVADREAVRQNRMASG